MGNIAVAKKALTHLTKRLEEQQRGVSKYTPFEYEPWFNCLADEVVMKVPCPSGTPVFESEFHGKQAVIDLFTMGDPVENLEMNRPLEYFGNGDRVVVLGAETYTLKKQGVTIGPLEFAMVLDFRDGLITRYLHIEDMSEYVEATR